MDKIYLLNSWPFLVKNLKNVVQDLQSKAKIVFDEEEPTSPARLVNATVKFIGYIRTVSAKNHYISNKQIHVDSTLKCLLVRLFVAIIFLSLCEANIRSCVSIVSSM